MEMDEENKVFEIDKPAPRPRKPPPNNKKPSRAVEPEKNGAEKKQKKEKKEKQRNVQDPQAKASSGRKDAWSELLFRNSPPFCTQLLRGCCLQDWISFF